MHDDLSAYAPPTVYPTHDRPSAEVLLDGVWEDVEVRMWCHGLDGWQAVVQLPAPHRPDVVMVPVAEVRGTPLPGRA